MRLNQKVLTPPLRTGSTPNILEQKRHRKAAKGARHESGYWPDSAAKRLIPAAFAPDRGGSQPVPHRARDSASHKLTCRVKGKPLHFQATQRT